HTLVPGHGVGERVDRGASVAARVDLGRVEDRLDVAVDDAGTGLRRDGHEVVTGELGVVLEILLLVAVAQGVRPVGRDLPVELGRLALLERGLLRGLDLLDGRLVALRDQQDHGVLRLLVIVERERLEQVCVRETHGSGDHLGGLCNCHGHSFPSAEKSSAARVSAVTGVPLSLSGTIAGLPSDCFMAFPASSSRRFRPPTSLSRSPKDIVLVLTTSSAVYPASMRSWIAYAVSAMVIRAPRMTTFITGRCWPSE